MEKIVSKISLVGFVGLAFFAGYIVRVVIHLLASFWGEVAQWTDSPLFEHGVPVAVGLGVFSYMSFSKSIRSWASDVILEVSRVVWPSRRDTRSMTLVVCFFMIMTGILLGIFDFFSSQIVQLFIDLG